MVTKKPKTTALTLSKVENVLPDDTDFEILKENLEEMGQVEFPRIRHKNGRFYFSDDPEEDGVRMCNFRNVRNLCNFSTSSNLYCKFSNCSNFSNMCCKVRNFCNFSKLCCNSRNSGKFINLCCNFLQLNYFCF